VKEEPAISGGSTYVVIYLSLTKKSSRLADGDVSRPTVFCMHPN
jgi:hypothetical protein